MPDRRIPLYIEVVCVSDRPRTITDPALAEIGGSITFQPLERKFIPTATFHRAGRPYLKSAQTYDLLHPVQPPAPDPHDIEETAVDEVEPEVMAPKRGRPKKIKGDNDNEI